MDIYIFYHIHLYWIVPTHHDSRLGSISQIPLSSTYCSESSCIVSPFISLLFHCLLFWIFLSFTLHKPCTLQNQIRRFTSSPLLSLSLSSYFKSFLVVSFVTFIFHSPSNDHPKDPDCSFMSETLGFVHFVVRITLFWYY